MVIEREGKVVVVNVPSIHLTSSQDPEIDTDFPVRA